MGKVANKALDASRSCGADQMQDLEWVVAGPPSRRADLAFSWFDLLEPNERVPASQFLSERNYISRGVLPSNHADAGNTGPAQRTKNESRYFTNHPESSPPRSGRAIAKNHAQRQIRDAPGEFAREPDIVDRARLGTSDCHLFSDSDALVRSRLAREHDFESTVDKPSRQLEIVSLEEVTLIEASRTAECGERYREVPTIQIGRCTPMTGRLQSPVEFVESSSSVPLERGGIPPERYRRKARHRNRCV